MKLPATYYESETIDTTVPKVSLEQQQLLLAEQQEQQSQPSSSASPSTKPQRCLRFASTMTIVEIPSRSDYTMEEKEASWFQAQDYVDFREQSYMTMGLYRAGLQLDEDQHCMRGLEGRLEEASRERGWLRHHATAAVFNEQYQQYHRCYYSPERIAEGYHAVAWKAQYAAYTLAMLDEQQAHATTTTLSSKLSLPLATTKTSTKRNIARRSEAQNVLRKVIDIERSSAAVDHALACGLQQHAIGEEFDVNSFFQDLVMPAQ